MRYLLCVCMGILILAPQLAIAKESTTKCPTLSFERRQVISLQDLGRLADEKITTGAAGSIMFRFFDGEDRPARDGAHAIGLILARMGDLGEIPVGGYLWMTGSTGTVVGEPVVKGDGGVASMTLTIDRNPAGCPPVALTFTLKQNGEFRADGIPVGKVK